ncbi:MAG: ssb [Mucilaginibacter sp.]|jgi:single-strand DNA-binding protein|nr:ssb [Mucilaginibacter sp.]MDB5017246.1 ssb [Mucilaginibacter sp.]MDB5140119.1 ssb [Mucilaginibacter sp.]
MNSTVNKVILIGHVGNSPEHKKLNGDISVTTFPLVTTTNFKKDGRPTEESEWHNIILWREMADLAFKLLEKGRLVYIEGRLQTRNFEKDGILKYSTEIIVNNFTLLGRKSDFDIYS